MKKIFFVIPTMGGGGAERVFLNILKHIDRQKFSPVLVLFEKKGEYLDQVPRDVRIYALKDHDEKWKFFGTVFIRLSKKMAALLVEERPDVILSFMWYTNFISIISRKISGFHMPLAISERYSVMKSHEGIVEERIRRTIIKHLYKYSDLVIVNSRELKMQLSQVYNIPSRKISVIYNPIDIDSIEKLSEKNNKEAAITEIPVISGMGRLTPQKGFPFLIRAISILNANDARCKLWILGDGPEKNDLRTLAFELGIGDKVEFLGFQENPYMYLRRSDIFVLSSLYEGFPNAMLEAMALGIPVVSTRCPTGPEEIISHGENGILVNPGNEKELADAIMELLQDDHKRAVFAMKGQELVQRFAVQRIVKDYESAISKILFDHGGRGDE